MFEGDTLFSSASKISIRRFVITEKALVGAFSVITNLRMELFQALENSVTPSNMFLAPLQQYFSLLHGKRKMQCQGEMS